MRRALTVWLLVSAAVFAGCNTIPQDGPVTETLTPAPVGDPRQSVTDRAADGRPAPAFPPGVTERGLVEPSALWRADAAALTERGYVASVRIERRQVRETTRETVQPPPGWVRRVARVTDDGERGLVTVVQRRAVWFDENGTLERTRAVEALPVRVTVRTNRSDDGENNRAVAETLRNVVAVGDYDSVSGTVDGAAARLYADRARDRPSTALQNVTDYEGQVVVDPAGRVRSATIRLVVADRTRVEYLVSYRLQQVGNVSVDRPAWAERAD